MICSLRFGSSRQTLGNRSYDSFPAVWFVGAGVYGNYALPGTGGNGSPPVNEQKGTDQMICKLTTISLLTTTLVT